MHEKLMMTDKLYFSLKQKLLLLKGLSLKYRANLYVFPNDEYAHATYSLITNEKQLTVI